MADFPGAVYAPRTKENKPGISYDSAKTTIGYAEDVVKLDNEVVAIETELGLNPKGSSADIAERIKGLKSLADANADVIVVKEGKVGIMTANPSVELEVNGSIVAGGISGTSLFISGNVEMDDIIVDRVFFKDPLTVHKFILHVTNPPPATLTADRYLFVAIGDTNKTLVLTGDATLDQDVSSAGNPIFAGLKTSRVAKFQSNIAADGYMTAIFGADVNADTLTNNYRKFCRMGMPHYQLAEQPVAFFFGDVVSNALAKMHIGGGNSAMNAFTDLYFYAAANTTTTTGSVIAHIDIDGMTVNGKMGIGVSDPHSKLEVNGAISSGQLVLSASNNNLDVSGVNTVLINITGDIILGGLTGGVAGQIIVFAYKGNYTNKITFLDKEGVGDQDLYMHSEGDEEFDGGGITFVCDGLDWYDCGHGRHV